MKQRVVKIREASEHFGVTPKTLRRWEEDGFITPAFKSPGGTRYYDVNSLKTHCDAKR